MDFTALTTAELLQALRDLAARERTATSDFMGGLAEADRRAGAVVSLGYRDLYDFCIRDLRLAESTAYQRVKAARLVRSRPEILSYLKDGSLNLKSLSLIAAHAFEHPELVETAKGKSTRDVEALIAGFGPGRAIPDRIRLRALPARVSSSPGLFDSVPNERPAAQKPDCPQSPPRQAAEAAESRIAPGNSLSLPETQAELRFAAGEPFLRTLERLRAVLWHKHPAGRLEDVFLTVMEEYLRRHDPSLDRRPIAAAAPAPDPRARRVSKPLSRRIWQRDGGRCAFAGPAGRCVERRGLEIDHIVPWALGGRSDDPTNLRLLCRAHNEAERRRIFGDDCARAHSCG